MNIRHFQIRTAIITLVTILLLGLPGSTALGSSQVKTVNASASVLGTAFTYQGQLTRSGSP
jgi:hypothetical protein